MQATTLNRSIDLTVLEKSETIYLLSSLINKACIMTAMVGAGSEHIFVLLLSAQLLVPEVPSAHSTAMLDYPVHCQSCLDIHLCNHCAVETPGQSYHVSTNCLPLINQTSCWPPNPNKYADKWDALKYWAEIDIIIKLKLCGSKTGYSPKLILKKKNRNFQLSQFQGQLSQVSVSLCAAKTGSK